MTYTEEAKQALSRKVAENLGIPEKIMVVHVNGKPAMCEMFMVGDEVEIKPLWLHEYNHAVIMELCVKHGVDASHDEFGVSACRWINDEWNEIKCMYSDCASPSEAERIARLLALGEC